MLEYFLKNDLVYYPSNTPDSWEEAIKISCEKLVSNGFITEGYINEIIESVIKFGPYIVIIPYVAIPHSKADSKSVKGSAISFTKFPNEVNFSDNKKASLFFSMAASNPEVHLENITKLTELLSDEELILKLLNTENINEYTKLI